MNSLCLCMCVCECDLSYSLVYLCVCAVLSLAGRVQGALGRLCAGDKGDSSLFKRVCECECVYVCVCLQEYVCALEACVSMFGACTFEPAC